MSSSLVPVTIAVLSALAPYLVWLWQRRTKQIGLYVIPLLHAAEDLQSRIYNLLERDGLGPLLARQGGSATLGNELVYLIATYCGWERVVCQHGPFVRDRQLVRATKDIRRVLATDGEGLDAACIFRSAQSDLGSAAVVLDGGGSQPLFRTAPQRQIRESIEKDDALSATVQAFVEAVRRDARVILSKDSPEGRRLGNLQSSLVRLLTYLERRADVSVSDVERRGVVRLPSSVTSRVGAAA